MILAAQNYVGQKDASLGVFLVVSEFHWGSQLCGSQSLRKGEIDLRGGVAIGAR